MKSRDSIKKKARTLESPHWMTTYSDMVTLLLAFFVLLFSFAVVDLEKFQKVLESIQLSLGYPSIVGRISHPPSGDNPVIIDEEITPEQLEFLKKRAEARELIAKVKKFIQEAGLEERIMLIEEDLGVVMELPDQAFFDRGRADLKPEAVSILNRLADLLMELPYMAVVEGHTCNLPINTWQFPSNWELSVVRAVRVTRFLVEAHNLDPNRFIATGYGEYRPLVSNDTAAGRAQNRRVSIVISVLHR